MHSIGTSELRHTCLFPLRFIGDNNAYQSMILDENNTRGFHFQKLKAENSSRWQLLAYPHSRNFDKNNVLNKVYRRLGSRKHKYTIQNVWISVYITNNSLMLKSNFYANLINKCWLESLWLCCK